MEMLNYEEKIPKRGLQLNCYVIVQSAVYILSAEFIIKAV